jgi:uncharacterized protein YukE
MIYSKKTASLVKCFSRCDQRGDMERIRVDSDELKAKSKAFETSAGIFAEAGKEILAVAAALPSYDGQLSGPARAAALEINKQCQDIHTALTTDADSLMRIAKAFEETDLQTIQLFSGYQNTISRSVSLSGLLSAQKVLLSGIDTSDWGPPWDSTTTEIKPGPLGRPMTVTTDKKILPDGSVVEHITQTWTIVPTPEEIKAWSTNEKLCLIGLNLLLFFLLGGEELIAKILGAVTSVLADVIDLLNIQIPDLSKYFYSPEPSDTVTVTQEVYYKMSPDGTRIDYERDVYHQVVTSSDGKVKNDSYSDTGWYHLDD